MKRIYATQNDRSKIVVIVSAAAALLGTTPLMASPSQRMASPSQRMASPSQTALAKADAPTAHLMSAKTQTPAKTQTAACSVIVHFEGDLTPQREAALKGLGAAVTHNLEFIHSAALTLPVRNLGKLAALPFITHLSYDGTVKKFDEFTDASSGAAYTRQQYGLTGKGVNVAVLDSGIQWHCDLGYPEWNSRLITGADFTGPQLSNDDCGHGSHVAGIIAGNGYMSTGLGYTHTYYGVAPQANLVSVRVLNRLGQSSVATVLAGLQWTIANKNTYNIRVINLSLGHPVGESYKTDPLCQAVEAAWKAGIVVVCAAGNDGRLNTTQSGTDNEGWGTAYGSVQSPANDPYVITVGATKSMDGNRANDRIATYSSRGPSRLDLVLKPDIVAPGNKVISIDVDWSALNYEFASTNLIPYTTYSPVKGTDNKYGTGMSDAYFVLSGTSMAAPVVSGAAALMLQKDPTLTPDTIKARLMVAADKWAFPAGSFEAEASVNTLANGARSSSYSLCSASACVQYVGNGGTLQFNQVNVPNAGTYMMTISYLNLGAGTRTGYLSVNGAAATSLSFPALANQVATIQVPVTLKAGANTLKFSNPSGWTGDIDKITLGLSDPLTFGAGYLNIPAALASTILPTQAALSPALVRDASGNVTIDTTVIASKAISGVTTIWGSKAISGVTTIWGSKAISGVSTVSSSKAVSGSTVWGDKTICGTSSLDVDLSNVAAYGE